MNGFEKGMILAAGSAAAIFSYLEISADTGHIEQIAAHSTQSESQSEQFLHSRAGRVGFSALVGTGIATLAALEGPGLPSEPAPESSRVVVYTRIRRSEG